MTVQIQYIDTPNDIFASLETFNREAQKDRDLARDLLRHTTYWVYDPQGKMFGPSKFVGFKGMNFGIYAAARESNSYGVRFNGHKTRKVIEKVLETYNNNPDLQLELIRWGEMLLGAGVFNGIDESKWRFVSL